MKSKEIMSNISSHYNQISKKGLLENDKKLLLKKFGFKNLQLSNTNTNIDKTNNNINNSLGENTLSSIKNDSRKPVKTLSGFNIINLKNNENLNTIKNKQIHSKNITQNNNQKNLLTTLNNSKIKQPKYRNNKSMASLALNTNIYFTEKNDYKIKNNVSSVNATATTAQNSVKTNIGVLSNADIIKPIEKSKSKVNYSSKMKNCSVTNLINKTKNNFNLNKEKPHKIYNNSTYLSNNKIKKKLSIDRNNNTINNYNKILSKEINKTVQNFYTKNNNKNNMMKLKNIKENINKNEIKNNITENNQNSDNTKKESVKELEKIFGDKIYNNINEDDNKKDLINNIITKNLDINNNNKVNSRNINNLNNNENLNINEQITINIENNVESGGNEEIRQKYFNNKKVLLPHTDTLAKKKNTNNTNNSSQAKNNYSEEDERIINNDNLIDDNQKEEKDKVNIINNNNDDKKYSIFYENYERDNEHNNNNEKKTNKNIYIKMNELDKNNYNNNNESVKQDEEEEYQPEADRQSEQTQTTLDKNYILSKIIKQPIYNIDYRFLNEENVNMRNILPDKKFFFIEDIEQEIAKIPIINIKKILNLSDKSLYNLLSYCYDKYSALISINNLLKIKFEKTLKTVFQHAINDFKNKYNSFIKVIDYKFNPKNLIINHKKSDLLNLEIKCQICTQEINKSYEIGCNYISNGKRYDNFWKFDVLNKKDIKLWICTELNKINNSFKNFTYTSQVTSFCNNDILNLQFNIFSKGNNIDPLSIEWNEPVTSPVPEGIFEKSKFICSYPFDQIRACEVEIQVLFWKNKLPKDDGGIVNEVKKIYGRFFEIKNISFDESKFYFFKIEMKAKKVGCLKPNKFSVFDINIIEKNRYVENEIQCIYLMNSYYYTKKMDIRVGTNVILYIVDMKR